MRFTRRKLDLTIVVVLVSIGLTTALALPASPGSDEDHQAMVAQWWGSLEDGGEFVVVAPSGTFSIPVTISSDLTSTNETEDSAMEERELVLRGTSEDGTAGVVLQPESVAAFFSTSDGPSGRVNVPPRDDMDRQSASGPCSDGSGPDNVLFDDRSVTVHWSCGT